MHMAERIRARSWRERRGDAADRGAPDPYPRSSSVAPSEHGAAGRRRQRPAQTGGLAQPRVVAGGERDHPGDERRCQRRAGGDRAQKPEHPVGVNRRRVDGEGHHHDAEARGEHRALRQRLRRDVDGAEQGHPEPVDEDRVAALGGEAVHDHQQDTQAEAPAHRHSQAAGRAGQNARHDHRGGNACEQNWIRGRERRGGQGPAERAAGERR
jgi:hypothetical protein